MSDSDASVRQAFTVLRAQAGDRAALDTLLRGVQERLFAFLRRVLGDPHLAEDVLQDVFTLICRKLGYLRDPRYFDTWAYRIASREAFSRLRRRKRQAVVALDEVEPVADGAPDEPELLDPELRERLGRHIQALSANTRAVVVLHYFAGLSLGEAAAVLEVPIGTAKSRLAHALRTLRTVLNKDDQP